MPRAKLNEYMMVSTLTIVSYISLSIFDVFHTVLSPRKLQLAEILSFDFSKKEKIVNFRVYGGEA